MSRTLRYGLALVGVVTAINFLVSSVTLFLVKVYGLTWWPALGLTFFTSLVAGSAITMAIVVTAPVLKDYLATQRRLWRLENLSHPLLVQLSQEAPSTYHHCIIVANLAYRAAKAIGADPILARLGGYYHDIGKLANPDLYIENTPDRNALASMDPQKAAKHITNHVKEGLKLAKQYNFPPELTAFITQHHGTTTASFFYEKAKQSGLAVNKQEFRYPGPKPLSREAAILMLADGIEAKVRSLAEFTPKNIGQAIDVIIEDKVNDNQLELSGLKPVELKKIRAAFTEAIAIMHHKRIKYARDEK